MDAVEVSRLTKRYGKVEALRGVDLRVSEGVVFGLVGPNGAGKTTLIKALVGALRPSGGEIRVLGLNPLEDRAERSEEHTSELQSRQYLVCRLLLEKKKITRKCRRLYSTR